MGPKSFKIAFTLGLVASATFGIPACSDDETPTPPATAGTAGAGATGGGAGTGGASGTGGAGAGGTAGTGGGGSITCGSNTCEPVAGGVIPACCIGDRCGIDPPQLFPDAGDPPCIELDQPGNPDPSCFADAGIVFDGGLEDFDASVLDGSGVDAAFLDSGVIPIPGCCRPDGQCGVLFNFPEVGLNLGCVGRDVYETIYSPGPPQSCTP